MNTVKPKALLVSITLDDNSFVRKLDNDESIPSLSQIRTKINDIKVDGNYCIEAIILKVPERREVQTKSGESISLSEMFVEDDTGQIWVKGWRNQARLIDKCELGEIVSITGLTAHAGRNELLNFVKNCKPKPKRIIINHGEISRSLDLASSLYKIEHVETNVPRNLETLRLK